MRRIAGGLVLVVLVALAGCTADDADPSPTAAVATAEPTTTPSTAPSPTPSAEPTPSAAPTSGPDQDVTVEPTEPAALDGPATEDNAVAVAKYFISLFPYAYATGDLDTWDDLSGPNCKYCASVHKAVKGVFSQGNHGVGGAHDIGFGSGSSTDSNSYIVSIDVKEYPSQTVASDGSVVEDFPDTRYYRSDLELSWKNNRWVIDGVAFTERGSE